MGNFIEADTVRLNRDKNAVSDMINTVQADLSRIYEQVAELGKMWDGAANDAFNKAFASDRRFFNMICDEGKALVQSIDFAGTEYEKCESQVGEIIKAIR